VILLFSGEGGVFLKNPLAGQSGHGFCYSKRAKAERECKILAGDFDNVF